MSEHEEIQAFAVQRGYPDALAVRIADLLTSKPDDNAPTSERVTWLRRRAVIVRAMATYPGMAEPVGEHLERLWAVMKPLTDTDELGGL